MANDEREKKIEAEKSMGRKYGGYCQSDKACGKKDETGAARKKKDTKKERNCMC